MVPGGQAHQLRLVRLALQLVDAREHVGEVADVVEVPTGLHPTVDESLAHRPDLRLVGGRTGVLAGSGPLTDQPLRRVGGVHLTSSPVIRQRLAIVDPEESSSGPRRDLHPSS